MRRSRVTTSSQSVASMATRRTSDPIYQRNRRALLEQSRSEQRPCWLCGRAIDYDARAPQPLSFSADHVEPVGTGGSNHGELRAAHLGCNKKRKDKRPEDVDILKTSRRW